MNFQIRKRKIPCSEKLEEYNRHRVSVNKSVFCFSPFNSLLFENDGRVFACCHNYKYDFGTYPVKSITEMWNGAKMKKFRDSLANNNLSKGCDVCRFDIDTGCFDTVQSLMFDNFPVNSNGFPSMFDFKLSNTCNLECVMCDGMHSSSIMKNKEKRELIQNPYDDEFIRQLEKYIPFLHTARFSGGEPFLIDIYYKIWEKIININPECTIRVQTNGSVLNSKIKDLLDRGNFELNISLDSVSQSTYEKIRKNSSYHKVMGNVKYFSEYSKNKRKFFGVTICPLRFNIYELPEIVKFCNSIGAVIWFSNVWLPPQLAIWTLPSREIKNIYINFSGVELPDGNNVERDNKKLFHDFVTVLGKWYIDATGREESRDLFKLPAFKKYIRGNIKKYFRVVETDKKLRKEKEKFLLDKADNIYHRFDPGEKIIRDYLKPIFENSSAYQLIDMFEGTPGDEIYEILRSFMPATKQDQTGNESKIAN